MSVAFLLDALPGLLWVLALCALLLIGLAALAYQDGFMAGQRAADQRNRHQQKYDYDRGVVEGQERTVEHLRATGQLPEFGKHPPIHLTDRPGR